MSILQITKLNSFIDIRAFSTLMEKIIYLYIHARLDLERAIQGEINKKENVISLWFLC